MGGPVDTVAADMTGVPPAMEGWSRSTVRLADAELEVLDLGAGPPVVMHPSLGRGAGDFEHLGRTVADAGFRSILVNPRGIGASQGSVAHADLHDVAADVWAVADALGIDRAVVLGHAFGNRVVRTASSDRPERTIAVVLLAAGGQVPPTEEVRTEFLRVFDPALPREDHLRAVASTFFAPGNNAGVWATGWYPAAAAGQSHAVGRTDFAEVYLGGTAPLLVVQGLQDRIAPPANAWNLVTARAGARLVALPDMGHAMLPERPDDIAAAVVAFLRVTCGGDPVPADRRGADR